MVSGLNNSQAIFASNSSVSAGIVNYETTTAMAGRK
jgi:hypothetical protein